MITEADIPDVPKELRAKKISKNFGKAWEDERKKKKPSLMKVVLESQKSALIAWFIWSAIYGLSGAVARPLLLKYLIDAATNDDDSESGMYLGLLAVELIFEGISMANSRQVFSGDLASSVSSALMCLIQKKSLKIPPEALTTERALVGNDIVRSFENAKLLSQGVASVFSVVGGSTVIIWTVGLPGVAGVGFLVLTLLVNQYLSTKTEVAEKNTLEKSDLRISMTTRAVEGIKAIKLSAWENPFLSAITKFRAEECSEITVFRFFLAAQLQLGRACPVLASCITFTVLSATDGDLKASEVFAVFSVFLSIRLSLILMPQCMTIASSISVSISRIQEYLTQRDCEGTVEMEPGSSDRLRLEGTFGYKKNKLTAKIVVPAGKTLAIVGPVGCGKTTVLSAALGGVQFFKGGSSTVKNIGYCSQKSFIVCGTIEDNIIMGRDYDEVRLRDAIKRSCLISDIVGFPNGRYTEIGERGVTLSGGQQQRICIARALYGDPQLLVLDDPLAAVDPLVANTIFSHVIKGNRSGASIIMSLNQMQYLPHFDHIIYMSKNGQIAEEGSFQQLMDSEKEFFTMIKETVGDIDALHNAVLSTKQEEPVEEEKPELQTKDEKLIQKEKRKEGTMSSVVMTQYFKSMGAPFVILCSVLLVVTYVTMGFNDRWLATWTDEYRKREDDPTHQIPDYFQYGYIIGSVVFSLLLVATSMSFSAASVKSAQALHNDCIDRVFHAPLTWFEETPSGRILSRFSADVSNTDNQLATALDTVAQLAATLVVLLVMICIVSQVVIPVVFVIIIVYGIQVYAMDESLREVKRMGNNSLSPVLSRLGESASPQGRVILRSMSLSKYIEVMFHKEVDTNVRFNYVANSIMMWGMLASYLISFVISCSTGAFMLYGPGSDDMSSSELGLVMTYSFLLPYFFLFFSMMYATLKAVATSLERLLDCKSDSVPQEPAWVTKTDKRISSQWPQNGEINFENATLRYRPNLPPSLKDVTLDIGKAQRIGVVGRTGAGKSSLVVLLFRLRELLSGTIKIDGVDISELGLQKLRQAMCVIPQEPLLLDDTLAKNLDPFNQHKTSDLQAALDKVNQGSLDLKANIKSLSTGQKQVVTLARALLSSAKIMILDEPTSNIDTATDDVIQRIIRDEWKDRTVVTIAHRLHTIIDADKVLVMDKGSVAEYDVPANLVKDPNTILSSMVDGLGEDAAKKLRHRATAPY
eukprot:TRINITY_DN1578_c5_g1_i1.p1 TRINITY_DN1578_c5_g1~~TRINITY_DN1578_c5_g1_i1.p1  ORF type:complete len:1288 (+),score=247.26 TRINITY_DN1578_c5_g1_i1:238-3864(+)